MEDNILQELGIIQEEPVVAQEEVVETEETVEAPQVEEEPKETEAAEAVEEKQDAGETQGPVVINLRDDVEPVVTEEPEGDTRIGDFESADALLDAYQSLNTEIESLKAQNPYASEEVKALNDYISKGGSVETFASIQAVKTESLSDLEAIILADSWKNPSVDIAKIRDHFSQKYNVPVDELGERDKAAVDRMEKGMSYDADIARSFINAHKQKTAVPDAELQRQQTQAEQEQRVTSWNAPLSTVMSSLKSIEIPLEGNTSIQYAIDKAELGDIQSQIMSMIEGSQGYKPTKENMNQVRDMALGLYKANHFDTIIGKLYNKLASDEKVKSFNEAHNPSAANVKSDVSPVSEAPKSTKDLVDGFLSGGL